MNLGLIQVRFDSERLPEKGLASISGQPVLWHIVNRLSAAHLLDKVVIATSNEAPDEPIRKFALKAGVDCYAGEKMDLTARLYGAAQKFNGDIILRVTGDCPLADPKLADQMIQLFLDNQQVDAVVNTEPPTFPDGLDLEVMPVRTLSKLNAEIKAPFYREWFTTYLVDPSNEFDILNLSNSEDLSALRWTLDYKEDLDFLRAVFSNLYGDNGVFSMAEVLGLLERSPELKDLNKGHIRNEGLKTALQKRGDNQ